MRKYCINVSFNTILYEKQIPNHLLIKYLWVNYLSAILSSNIIETQSPVVIQIADTSESRLKVFVSALYSLHFIFSFKTLSAGLVSHIFDDSILQYNWINISYVDHSFDQNYSKIMYNSIHQKSRQRKQFNNKINKIAKNRKSVIDWFIDFYAKSH